jgi:hypothetical protein
MDKQTQSKKKKSGKRGRPKRDEQQSQQQQESQPLQPISLVRISPPPPPLSYFLPAPPLLIWKTSKESLAAIKSSSTTSLSSSSSSSSSKKKKMKMTNTNSSNVSSLFPSLIEDIHDPECEVMLLPLFSHLKRVFLELLIESVDKNDIDAKLRIIQSSSPSALSTFLLLGSKEVQLDTIAMSEFLQPKVKKGLGKERSAALSSPTRSHDSNKSTTLLRPFQLVAALLTAQEQQEVSEVSTRLQPPIEFVLRMSAQGLLSEAEKEERSGMLTEKKTDNKGTLDMDIITETIENTREITDLTIEKVAPILEPPEGTCQLLLRQVQAQRDILRALSSPLNPVGHSFFNTSWLQPIRGCQWSETIYKQKVEADKLKKKTAEINAAKRASKKAEKKASILTASLLAAEKAATEVATKSESNKKRRNTSSAYIPGTLASSTALKNSREFSSHTHVDSSRDSIIQLEEQVLTPLEALMLLPPDSFFKQTIIPGARLAASFAELISRSLVPPKLAVKGIEPIITNRSQNLQSLSYTNRLPTTKQREAAILIGSPFLPDAIALMQQQQQQLEQQQQQQQLELEQSLNSNQHKEEESTRATRVHKKSLVELAAEISSKNISAETFLIAEQHLGATLSTLEQEEFDALGAQKAIRLPLSASTPLFNIAQTVTRLSNDSNEVNEDLNFTRLMLHSRCNLTSSGIVRNVNPSPFTFHHRVIQSCYPFPFAPTYKCRLKSAAEKTPCLHNFREDLSMIQCRSCGLWVHWVCASLDSEHSMERYETLDPNRKLIFRCSSCCSQRLVASIEAFCSDLHISNLLRATKALFAATIMTQLHIALKSTVLDSNLLADPTALSLLLESAQGSKQIGFDKAAVLITADSAVFFEQAVNNTDEIITSAVKRLDTLVDDEKDSDRSLLASAWRRSRIMAKWIVQTVGSIPLASWLGVTAKETVAVKETVLLKESESVSNSILASVMQTKDSIALASAAIIDSSTNLEPNSDFDAFVQMPLQQQQQQQSDQSQPSIFNLKKSPRSAKKSTRKVTSNIKSGSSLSMKASLINKKKSEFQNPSSDRLQVDDLEEGEEEEKKGAESTGKLLFFPIYLDLTSVEKSINLRVETLDVISDAHVLIPNQSDEENNNNGISIKDPIFTTKKKEISRRVRLDGSSVRSGIRLGSSSQRGLSLAGMIKPNLTRIFSHVESFPEDKEDILFKVLSSLIYSESLDTLSALRTSLISMCNRKSDENENENISIDTHNTRESHWSSLLNLLYDSLPQLEKNFWESLVKKCWAGYATIPPEIEALLRTARISTTLAVDASTAMECITGLPKKSLLLSPITLPLHSSLHIQESKQEFGTESIDSEINANASSFSTIQDPHSVPALFPKRMWSVLPPLMTNPAPNTLSLSGGISAPRVVQFGQYAGSPEWLIALLAREKVRQLESERVKREKEGVEIAQSVIDQSDRKDTDEITASLFLPLGKSAQDIAGTLSTQVGEKIKKRIGRPPKKQKTNVGLSISVMPVSTIVAEETTNVSNLDISENSIDTLEKTDSIKIATSVPFSLQSLQEERWSQVSFDKLTSLPFSPFEARLVAYARGWLVDVKSVAETAVVGLEASSSSSSKTTAVVGLEASSSSSSSKTATRKAAVAVSSSPSFEASFATSAISRAYAISTGTIVLDNALPIFFPSDFIFFGYGKGEQGRAQEISRSLKDTTSALYAARRRLCVMIRSEMTRRKLPESRVERRVRKVDALFLALVEEAAWIVDEFHLDVEEMEIHNSSTNQRRSSSHIVNPKSLSGKDSQTKGVRWADLQQQQKGGGGGEQDEERDYQKELRHGQDPLGEINEVTFSPLSFRGIRAQSIRGRKPQSLSSALAKGHFAHVGTSGWLAMYETAELRLKDEVLLTEKVTHEMCSSALMETLNLLKSFKIQANLSHGQAFVKKRLAINTEPRKVLNGLSRLVSLNIEQASEQGNNRAFCEQPWWKTSAEDFSTAVDGKKHLVGKRARRGGRMFYGRAQHVEFERFEEEEEDDDEEDDDDEKDEGKVKGLDKIEEKGGIGKTSTSRTSSIKKKQSIPTTADEAGIEIGQIWNKYNLLKTLLNTPRSTSLSSNVEFIEKEQNRKDKEIRMEMEESSHEPTTVLSSVSASAPNTHTHTVMTETSSLSSSSLLAPQTRQITFPLLLNPYISQHTRNRISITTNQDEKIGKEISTHVASSLLPSSSPSTLFDLVSLPSTLDTLPSGSLLESLYETLFKDLTARMSGNESSAKDLIENVHLLSHLPPSRGWWPIEEKVKVKENGGSSLDIIDEMTTMTEISPLPLMTTLPVISPQSSSSTLSASTLLQSQTTLDGNCLRPFCTMPAQLQSKYCCKECGMMVAIAKLAASVAACLKKK